MTEVAVRDAALPAKSLVGTYDDLERMADKLATSSIKEFAGKPGDCFIYLLIMRDTGMTALEVVNNFYIVDGKLAAWAQYMLSQVRKAGHKVTFEENGSGRNDDYRWTCTIVHADERHDPDAKGDSITWSLKRAKDIKLYDVGKQTSAWYKYYPSLLRWRAFTEVARFACPESLGFVKYTPEELGAEVNDLGIPIVTTAEHSRAVPPQGATIRPTAQPRPEPVTVTRVTPPAKKAAAAAPPKTAPAPATIPGTAVPTPAKAPQDSAPAQNGSARTAQDLYADALRIVKEVGSGAATEEHRRSFNKLLVEATVTKAEDAYGEMKKLEDHSVEMPPAKPGGPPLNRPLKAAFRPLEKALVR